MNIAYGSNKLRKQLGSATEVKKAFGNMAKEVMLRLAQINAAENLAILKKAQGARCHQLKADRKEDWALDISKNHRMIFLIAHDPVPENDDGSVNTILVTDIIIIKTEDYH
jgi:plasmid maintenance system killer protein